MTFLLFASCFHAFAQNALGEEIFEQKSNFTPVIKDAAVKQTDQPDIVDTVKKITNVAYSTPGIPYKTSYQTSTIEPAKMVNEPLSKLYQSMLKVGFGNYTMPYADVFLNGLRSKDLAWGIRYNHLSSDAKFAGLGRTNFSDDNASLYVKKFYKKHTLSAEANYNRNAIHYYGFSDTVYNANSASNYQQVFQNFQGKLRLQSHYADTAKSINHDIHVNYYNYGDHYNTFENNVFADVLLTKHADKELFSVLASADYYNVHSSHDTINNIIARVNPSVAIGGEKWKANVGFEGVLDNFSATNSNFSTNGSKYYVYPRINIFYDVFQSIIIPYAGMDGGLTKNSYKSLSSINPFVLSNLAYKNTDNKYNLYGGLRGALSSNLSYDAKVLYGRYNNMAYYLADYNYNATDNPYANRYKVVYMNTNYLNINAQLKYQLKQKINFIAKGNYYGYTITDTSNVKPWHKPNFDLTFSANYNLKSKIILRADIFVIGKQWALQQTSANNVIVETPVLLNGITDINLGAEYRYTKMLSFFANFNNIGNFSYYRWDKYPTQRFNFMVGLSFIPF
ncbi:MAG: TonB-dependent receptor [Bacteroidia bacterium]